MVLLTDEWVLVLINYGVVDDDTQGHHRVGGRLAGKATHCRI